LSSELLAESDFCYWLPATATCYSSSIIIASFLGMWGRNSSKACTFSGGYIYSQDELNSSFHGQPDSGVFQQTNSIVRLIRISISSRFSLFLMQAIAETVYFLPLILYSRHLRAVNLEWIQFYSDEEWICLKYITEILYSDLIVILI
jgi:hypothetical protein